MRQYSVFSCAGQDFRIKSSGRERDGAFDDTDGREKRGGFQVRRRRRRRNQVRHGFLRRARHDGRARPNQGEITIASIWITKRIQGRETQRTMACMHARTHARGGITLVSGVLRTTGPAEEMPR